MQFTGKNLELVRCALELGLQEVHNMIATCPDVVEYAEDIEAHEAERDRIQKLLNRINKVPA